MRRSWRISAVCLIVALAGLPALAEHTRFWRTTNYSDFERGTAKGVALWSDGKLVPAAEFGHFADPNLAYLWTLRTDSKGQLYASGGSNARVFRFDKQGHPTTVFQSSELTAQAIAFDAHDNLYVGTSPDGKVYKVTPDGKSSVFFDPKTKYIWSLAIDRDGVVYVGTGDKGEIYAVTPSGKSALFYKSDERHIRALALDGKGDLIAGTDPSGLVIRIAIHRGAAGEPPKAGEAFVIYETAGQEITALDFGRHGNLYAASIGAKHGQEAGPIAEATGTTFVFSASPSATTTAAQAAAAAVAAQGTTPQPAPFTPLTATPGGSHVYRIAPDGSPKLLWESRSDLVYSLGFSPDGKLLLGTGNSGEVIELEGDEIFSKVAETASGQVTGIPLPVGLVDGSRLPEPIFTPATKAEYGEHDENVPFAAVAELVGRDAAAALRDLTLSVYARAETVARERGVILADTKLEFGTDPVSGQITLGDEVLTPDSSRFWPADSWEPGRAQPSFDKQYVRDWLTSDASGWDRAGDAAPPPLPADVVARTRARYLEAYERITGSPLVVPEA